MIRLYIGHPIPATDSSYISRCSEGGRHHSAKLQQASNIMRVLCFVAMLAVGFAAPLEEKELVFNAGLTGLAGGKMTTTKQVTVEGLPSGLPANWMAADGEARLGRRMMLSEDAWRQRPEALRTTKFVSESSSPMWAKQGRAAWDDKPFDMAKMAKITVDGPAKMSWDGKMIASGRSAWDSSAAHLVKDAHPMVEILQQEYEMPQPGNYVYSYKTANGIEAQEQAALKAEDTEAVQGAYAWVAPNGEKFAVEYVADETGYHARGAHIPEMPRAIARSLEWNAAHPEEEDPRSWESSEASAKWMSSSPRIAGSRSAWDATATGFGIDSKKVMSSQGISSWGADTSRFGLARSAWDSDAVAGSLGATKVTKITKTSTLGAPTFEHGLFPAGRSAWDSDVDGHLGATKVTKITKTSTIGAPAGFSQLDLNTDAKLIAGGQAAWDVHEAPRLGYGRSVVTKVVEQKHSLNAEPTLKL